MGYKVAQIDELQKKLEELPEVNDIEREVTKQEAIRRMADTISQLQARGYSMEKISEILTTGGLQISVPTLKSYLTRAKQVTRKKPRRKGAAKSAPSSTPRGATPQASSAPQPAQPATKTNDGLSPQARSSSFTPRQDSKEL
jgi:hypothetical protein